MPSPASDPLRPGTAGHAARRLCFGLAAAAALLLPATSSVAEDQKWSFDGNDMAQKYSAATQITPQNVGRLQRAWSMNTGDLSKGHTAWSATPVFANNTLYVSTPFSRTFAVAPDTGKVKWIYDGGPVRPGDPGRTRGVAYWQAQTLVPGQPCQKIIYMGTLYSKLHAMDADTGKRCAAFGQNGVLDLTQWNTVNPVFGFGLIQPPTIYKDTVIIGWAGVDWTYQAAPPGTVFGVDARTGKLKWTFSSIPKVLEKKIGTANVWAGMSVDTKAGLIYLPVSSPEANFYGGDRKAPLPLVTSVTALNADTGAIVWSRQLVHHDLWDFDTNSAPTLIDIDKDGRKIPALVQATKMGFLFVLNRLTGEPIYPITERPVPRSDIPGERASPTQPYVALPEPTVSDRFSGISALGDWTSFGYCSRTLAKLRYEGRFTPPSLQGSLTFPGYIGGVEWGGGAVDPVSQTYVVNSSAVAMISTLIPRAQYDANVKAGRKTGAPQEGTPYAVSLTTFLNPLGIPCWKPPYGTLSSYDLKTGKLLWREPFGVMQKLGFYMPDSWGSVTLGGPAITKSGLIFIGASVDSRVRAIDVKSGKTLWRQLVNAPVIANPSIYTYGGKQYVVFTAGGNDNLSSRVGDQLVAFALPD